MSIALRTTMRHLIMHTLFFCRENGKCTSSDGSAATKTFAN